MIHTVKGFSQRINAFELWCWRRLLRVPWTARRSSQSILKEMFIGRADAEYFGHLMVANTLATWCEELTHLKRPWCWERLRAGGVGDDRGWDGWMTSPIQWTWVWVDFESWWWTGRPGVLHFMGLQRVGHDWATELNEAEVDVFLELSCFFYNPTYIDNWISDSCTFSKSSLYIWSSRFTYCWSLVWRVLRISLLVCEMSAIVQ